MPFNSYPIKVAKTTAQNAVALPVISEAQMYVNAGLSFTIAGVSVTVAQNFYINAFPALVPVVALPGQIVAGTGVELQNDDNVRIRKHLSMPFSLRAVVDTQMALIQSRTPTTVTLVQNVLAELDALEANLKSFAQDASNTGLIKAGPLEWGSAFSKTANVDLRMSSLRSELSGYLDLDSWTGCGGNAKLYRS